MPPPEAGRANGRLLAETAGAKDLDGCLAGKPSVSLSRTARTVDTMEVELAGAFVVRVVVSDIGGTRDLIFRTVASAEKAVARAKARGRDARVLLCTLQPIGEVLL
jgi:hypothetical protein